METGNACLHHFFLEDLMKRQPCSTDYWHARVLNTTPPLNHKELERQMLEALKREIPEMCSVTMERACNLQCHHCLYRPEKSSEALSRANELPRLVLEAVTQLPGKKPRLLHEGRILQPWHVDVLAEARGNRSDLQIGLIDNGTYVRHLGEFERRNFLLDWLDISLDGPETVHNAQRGSSTAFSDALIGLQHAREVTKSAPQGGRITSLFTLTSLNQASFEETAELLFARQTPLVDQLHVTTMSPTRPELELLEQMDLREFWSQARRVFSRHGSTAQGQQRIFLRLYRHQELTKLARVVGTKELSRAFTEGVRFAPGEVYFTLDGVPCIFAPLSLWPGEEFLIDADGRYGMAYSIGQTLSSLRRGTNENSEDVSGYSVAQLTPGFDLRSLYQKCVDQWWRFKGQRYLEEEAEIFRLLTRP